MGKKTWTAKQKLEIVLEGLKKEKKIGEVCRKYGISHSVYYKWRNTLLEKGEEALKYEERNNKKTENHYKENTFSSKQQYLLLLLSRCLSFALERSREVAYLREISYKDALTGLYNFRYFEEYLRTSFNEAYFHNSPLSLLLIDLDNLKTFNDTFGHNEGNALVKAFATLLLKGARKQDCVVRYGGDEFVIVLPNTDYTSALKIAQRIKKQIQEYVHYVKGKAVKITASIGIATYPGYGCKDAESLFTLADKALYEAKRNGKNQICSSLGPTRKNGGISEVFPYSIYSGRI